MQDIHDLRCKNIIIINEYELQIPLISLFDRKNIDRGDLAQHFMPKNAVFTVFFIFWVKKNKIRKKILWGICKYDLLVMGEAFKGSWGQ